MAESDGKRIAVTPDSAHAVAHALRVYADLLSRPDADDTKFTVDIYDGCDGIIETIARCSSLLVGRAAFAQAVKERPGLKVTLRHGIRIIEKQEVRDDLGRLDPGPRAADLAQPDGETVACTGTPVPTPYSSFSIYSLKYMKVSSSSSICVAVFPILWPFPAPSASSASTTSIASPAQELGQVSSGDEHTSMRRVR